MDIKKFIPVTSFDLRGLLEKSAPEYFPGTFVSLSYSKPRVSGELNGYQVEYGMGLDNSESGIVNSFFFRVKLKSAQRIPFFLRNRLPLNNTVSLRYRWLHEEVPIFDNVDLNLLREVEKKHLPSVKRKISALIELAKEIDSGSYDVASVVRKAKSSAKRESAIVLVVFSVGTFIVLGLSYLYVRYWW